MTDRLEEIRALLDAATSSHYAHERFEAQEKIRSHAEDDIAWLLAEVEAWREHCGCCDCQRMRGGEVIGCECPRCKRYRAGGQ